MTSLSNIFGRFRNLMISPTSWTNSYSSSLYASLIKTQYTPNYLSGLQKLTVSDEIPEDELRKQFETNSGDFPNLSNSGSFITSSSDSVLGVEVEELKHKLFETTQKLDLYMTMVEQLFDIIARKDVLLASQDASVAKMFHIIEEFIKTLHSEKMDVLFAGLKNQMHWQSTVEIQQNQSLESKPDCLDVSIDLSPVQPTE